MSKFWASNLNRAGRLARGVVGLALIGGGFYAGSEVWWLGALLVGGGALGLFEALRGWCVLRACGIKTRL